MTKSICYLILFHSNPNPPFWYICRCNALQAACLRFPSVPVCAGHESELTPPREACASAQWATPESASEGLQQLPSKNNIIKGRAMFSVAKAQLAWHQFQEKTMGKQEVWVEDPFRRNCRTETSLLPVNKALRNIDVVKLKFGWQTHPFRSEISEVYI